MNIKSCIIVEDSDPYIKLPLFQRSPVYWGVSHSYQLFNRKFI